MNAHKLRGLIAHHVQCQRREAWAGTGSPEDAEIDREEAHAAAEALYAYIRELDVQQRVVPIHPVGSISASLQRFDASHYKHALLVAIEEPTIKPDVFSFGNGANPMEEIAALFTALRIRSEGETT